MSEVKRYDAGCDYAGEDEMVERIDGDYVKYNDYAELKAKRDALAAENAALKNYIKSECFIMEVGAHPMAEADISAEERMPTTPATAAYLNSVRAEAVQKLWNDSLNDVGHMLRDIGAFRDASGAAGIVHDEIKERVEEFANQLRAGEPS